jgi:phosphoglycolate phosphatase-like HAD superfamily hydrolase
MLENTSALSDIYRSARCVFLDCDGVIFDSNAFKLEAMYSVLARYPGELREAMAHYWKQNGGVSRHVKFRYFFREIVGVPPVESSVEEVAARFADASLEGYRRRDPLPKALAFARASGANRTFVVSGALQSELELVFAEKGIDTLFGAVLGSPIEKRELMERMMAVRGCPPDRALLIGDGAGDFRACQALGIHFAFLAEYSDWADAEKELSGAPAVSMHATWAELLGALQVSYTS